MNPGDLVCGDNTGVIVVPFERVEEVLAVAKNIEKVEQQILQKVREGMPLKEARKQICISDFLECLFIYNPERIFMKLWLKNFPEFTNKMPDVIRHGQCFIFKHIVIIEPFFREICYTQA